jgi:hypothetical protein
LGTTEPVRYQLTTLRDVFEKVPVDKIELCMSEIARSMVLAKNLHGLAQSLSPTEKVVAVWPETSEWIDDGKGVVGVDVVFGDQAVPVRLVERDPNGTGE